MVIPIILCLYLKAIRVSMPCFMTTNSAPKTDFCDVGGFLENYRIKAVFIHIKNPLLNL